MRYYWKQILISTVLMLIIGVVLTLMERTYEIYLANAGFIPYESRRESQSILPYLYTGRKEIPPEQKLLAIIASKEVLREFIDSTGYRFHIIDKSPQKMKILSVKVKEIPPDSIYTVITNREDPYVEISSDVDGTVKLEFIPSEEAAMELYRDLEVKLMNIQEILGISQPVEGPSLGEENLKVVIFQLAERDPYIREIVKEFSRFLIRYNIREKTLKYQNSKRFISRQIQNYMDELDRLNYRIRIFKLKSTYMDTDKKNPAWVELLELERQKISIRTEIEFMKRWLKGEIEPQFIVSTDEDIKYKIQELYMLEDSLSTLEILYGKNSQQYRLLKEKLEKTRENFRDFIKKRIKNMEARLQFLNMKERNIKSLIGKSMEQEKEILTLQARKKAIEDILTLLSQRLEEIRIEEAEVVPDFKIMEVSMRRVIKGRHWKRNLLASILFALLFAISYILIAEYASNTIRTADEVFIKLGIPREKLYEIPYIEDEDEMPINILLKNMKEKLIQGSGALEAFRMIALREIINRNLRLTGATSSIQGEGKTFFLINLAAVLAMMRRRVVVLDGDLRKKNISELFDLKGRTGLSSIMDIESFDEIIHRVSDNLYIVPAGDRFVDPIAIFSSEKYDRLLQHLKENFDYVLVDIPPVLNVAETSVSIDKLEKVFFIIRALYTETGAVEKALAMLQDDKIEAYILNSVGITGGGYYGYYRYYRKYYYSRET